MPFRRLPDDCRQSECSDSSVPGKDPAQEGETTHSSASELIDGENL